MRWKMNSLINYLKHLPSIPAGSLKYNIKHFVTKHKNLHGDNKIPIWGSLTVYMGVLPFCILSVCVIVFFKQTLSNCAIKIQLDYCN